MPVGTRAAVRHLAAADHDLLGVEVVLANTYHLMLRPGDERIARLGGLHDFAGWQGHYLTDSGGYQVFSLSPDVDDDGVRFRSTYDGSTHDFTPEDAVRVQRNLGADIQMVLDVCPPLPSSRPCHPGGRRPDGGVGGPSTYCVRRRRRRDPGAVRHRPGRDRRRISDESRPSGPSPATSTAMRSGGCRSVRTVSRCSRPSMRTTRHLPADRLRYLMGVGDPVGLVEGIAMGVDMFDCVLPTRLARHGTALTWSGRKNLKNREFADDDRPIDPEFDEPATGQPSRAYRPAPAQHQ